MTESADQQKAVFQVSLTHEPGRSIVRVERVLKSRPLETKTLVEYEFQDRVRAEDQYREIVEHPFPQQKSFPRSALKPPQDKVTCLGKSEPYIVPGILQTYTRRGYSIVLDPHIDPETGKVDWIAAKLTDLDESIVNIAFGKSPWAALCVLSLITQRWHVYNVTGEIRTSRVKRSDLPSGAVLTPPITAVCPEHLRGHPEII